MGDTAAEVWGRIWVVRICGCVDRGRREGLERGVKYVCAPRAALRCLTRRSIDRVAGEGLGEATGLGFRMWGERVGHEAARV